jgi:hypothetical protein
MESLHLGQYQPYIILAVGIISIIISLFYKSTAKTLEKTGERCEGIIFKLDYSKVIRPDMVDSAVKDKITVRFVTNNKEWITQDLHSDFMIFYTGQYKEGDRVIVIYNPENPSEFMVETKQSEKTGRLVGFFVGLVFIGTGIYELFK